jgi:hypothetical protein
MEISHEYDLPDFIYTLLCLVVSQIEVASMKLQSTDHFSVKHRNCSSQ